MTCACIVAGWDKYEGGQVYSCPMGGSMHQEDWTVDGSGSTYIWGYCKHAYVKDMTEEQAHQFVVTALALGMSKDAGSGGVIRTKVITKDGVKDRYIPENEIPLFGTDFAPVNAPDAMVVG